ncbi:MAG TPA: hypothetical protein VG938_20250 [Verrucomicrobiae bacterium]|jgi:hypothetical protein|nr:hypothetical protein [Verrucomicrobiae bacterium]
MTIRFNPRWLLVPILLLSLQFCRAQVVVLPSNISFNLGGSDAPDTQLWDLGGNYLLDMMVVNNRGAATEVRVSFALVQDASGRLSSITEANFGELDLGDNSFFAVVPRVTGKVTGSGGTAQVHFTVRMTGNGTLAGQTVNSLNASVTVNAETDATTGLLTGSAKFSASFPGFLSVNGRAQDFSTPMPQGANAAWNLSLQLAGLSKLTGTGIITTSSRPLGLDLSGKLKNGVANISAHGADNVANTVPGATGLSATMQLADPFDSIFFKGKLLGQRFVFSFPEE